MNQLTEERVKQIREGLARVRRDPSLADPGYAPPLWEDIDFLLSLIDSQAAGCAGVECLHCGRAIRRIGSAWLHVETELVSCRKGKSQEHGGIYRAEPATREVIASAASTAMRDACVETVKARLAVLEKQTSESGGLSRACCEGRDAAIREIITSLESTTLDPQ